MSQDYSKPYWMEVPVQAGEQNCIPKQASVVVIGSGLTGVSAGYFLNEQGFEDVVIVDSKPEISASFRNCGHILYGTVESMKAMTEIHGSEKAKELWQFSIDICELIPETIDKLNLEVEYKKDGYLVVGVSEVEDLEIRESVELLNRMGFQSDYVDAQTVKELGFKNCFGARFEKGSAQAHPVRFRNGVLNGFLNSGGKYYSGIEVLNVEEQSEGVLIHTAQGQIRSEAVVIAANAYSPLFSDFFKSRGLIDPFRGQILASKQLKHSFRVPYPHSFDHGYEYAIVSSDNRLILGGWRNHSQTQELGTYSLGVNPYIEDGLKQFAKKHYAIDEDVEWEYSWSGIMAASRTGLPFIGNTTSPRIYACCGFTGHGFSWGHGSAKLLADIIAGDELPSVAKYFNPKTIL